MMRHTVATKSLLPRMGVGSSRGRGFLSVRHESGNLSDMPAPSRVQCGH